MFEHIFLCCIIVVMEVIMATVKITKKNFSKEVMKSEVPVLLDFWAPWCMPCKMVGPTLEKISAELEGRVKIGKINVDEEPDLAKRYKVMTIPMLMVMNRGKSVNSISGFKTKRTILKMLKDFI